jgi:pyrroloquinoline quinone biosynthesis protein D
MMPAPATRAIVTGDSIPALRAHVRLHFDPVREAWAVLSPERVLWPDEIGRDILVRCDGRTSVAGIAAALAEEYDADRDEIGRDVREFLQLWSDRLLVRL